MRWYGVLTRLTARQFLEVADQLGRLGVQVRLTEANGLVEPRDPATVRLVTLLGAHAKREFVRARAGHAKTQNVDHVADKEYGWPRLRPNLPSCSGMAESWTGRFRSGST